MIGIENVPIACSVLISWRQIASNMRTDRQRTDGQHIAIDSMNIRNGASCCLLRPGVELSSFCHAAGLCIFLRYVPEGWLSRCVPECIVLSLNIMFVA